MPSALLSPHLSDLHPSSGLHEHARHVLVTLALPWPGMVPFPDSGATYSAHSWGLSANVTPAAKPFLITFFTSPCSPRLCTPLACLIYSLLTFYSLTMLFSFIFCLPLEHNATRQNFFLCHSLRHLWHLNLSLAHHRPLITGIRSIN